MYIFHNNASILIPGQSWASRPVADLVCVITLVHQCRNAIVVNYCMTAVVRSKLLLLAVVATRATVVVVFTVRPDHSNPIGHKLLDSPQNVGNVTPSIRRPWRQLGRSAACLLAVCVRCGSNPAGGPSAPRRRSGQSRTPGGGADPREAREQVRAARGLSGASSRTRKQPQET